MVIWGTLKVRIKKIGPVFLEEVIAAVSIEISISWVYWEVIA